MAALADAIARAVAAVDRSLCWSALPGSALIAGGQRAQACGPRPKCSPIAAIGPTARWLPRDAPGAVLARRGHGGGARVCDGRAIARSRRATARVWRSTVDTICIHGDTPGAAALAQRRLACALLDARRRLRSGHSRRAAAPLKLALVARPPARAAAPCRPSSSAAPSGTPRARAPCRAPAARGSTRAPRLRWRAAPAFSTTQALATSPLTAIGHAGDADLEHGRMRARSPPRSHAATPGIRWS